MKEDFTDKMETLDMGEIQGMDAYEIQQSRYYERR
jgi:hypothetical protein